MLSSGKDQPPKSDNIVLSHIDNIHEPLTPIGNKYKQIKKLSEGAFGIVYLGENERTKEKIVIKIAKSPNVSLTHESKILNYLYSKMRSNPLASSSISPIYWFGKHESMLCLVIPYYEIDLFSYVKARETNGVVSPSIPVPTIEVSLEIIDKIAYSLQHIHKQGVIHRDIKPQNIMFKQNGDPILIDFGLSCFYVDENWNHSPCEYRRETIIGTTKYASYNIHCGIRPSRRDDYLSLAYIALCLLFCGSNYITHLSSYIDRINLLYSSADMMVCTDADTENEKNIEYNKNRIMRECKRRSTIMKFLESWKHKSAEEKYAIFFMKQYIIWAYDLKYDEDPDYHAFMDSSDTIYYQEGIAKADNPK